MNARHRYRMQARIDWFRVLADLQAAGYDNAVVAKAIDVPRQTLGGWKDGSEPKFIDGQRLLHLWEDLTGGTTYPQEAVPPKAGIPAR